MAVKDWSTSPASNTSIDGTDIGEGCPASGINNAIRSVMAGVKKTLSGLYNVLDYGATGDGTTNDTAAIQAAAAALATAGGGTLIIPPGTYIVGTQTFAGSSGLGYSYNGVSVIQIDDCTKPVRIIGHGAKLKAAAGLKYGSFDPVTGVARGSISTANDDRATGVAAFISCSDNVSVTVEGLELDGNVDNYVLGGDWGDTGKQLAGYGIIVASNEQVSIRDCYIHHQPLDAIAVSYTGLTVTSLAKPHTIENVRCEYNGRQGLSVVGTNSLTVINSAFNYTGRNTAGVSSSPGAGIDLEAESSINRNMTFINCEAVHNAGQGMVADSGDSADATFIRCKFIGTTTFAIWPRKPSIRFLDCLIAGQVTSLYSSLLPGEATFFQGCTFTFDTGLSPTAALYNSTTYLADMGGGAEGVVFQGCGFDTAGTGLLPISASINVTYRDCTFEQSNTGVNSMNAVFEGTTRINCPSALNTVANGLRGRFILNGTESALYATAPTATDLATAITLANALKAALDGLKITG